jgi:large subunit ribosomal protein L4e
MALKVLSKEGKMQKEIAEPEKLSYPYKPWLINRAVLAENTWQLQPQGHYLLAGMQTTAVYVGQMHKWRTGRHVGRAIRPREKLAEGALGKVRRIPSATTGKRASPHLIEKNQKEKINKKEYASALYSAISKTFSNKKIVLDDAVESITKAKDVNNILKMLGVWAKPKKHVRSGVRRSSRIKKYGHIATIVIKGDKGIGRAARNIPGIKVCGVDRLSVGRLMPGGSPKAISIWTESAIMEIDEIGKRIKIEM